MFAARPYTVYDRTLTFYVLVAECAPGDGRCHSDLIPSPPVVADAELAAAIATWDNSKYRIPMSIGEPHAELDSAKQGCTYSHTESVWPLHICVDDALSMANAAGALSLSALCSAVILCAYFALCMRCRETPSGR
jgi:hypothetical protein